MNKIAITGNIVRDPEHRVTQSGLSVCTFTVAVGRKFKDAGGQRGTDFIPVVAWRQSADFCARYLSKGRKVAVTGSLQTRTYDAQDGTKRYVTEIVADEVEALDKAREDVRHTDAYEPEPPPIHGKQEAMDMYAQDEDDELPF